MRVPNVGCMRGGVAIAVWSLACVAGCSGGREADMAPPIAVASPDVQLVWGAAAQVPGTQVMRVDLIGDRSGLSCKGGEIRNILFLDPAEKAGRWLLPDSQHVLDETFELATDVDDPKAKRTLATVSLVKPIKQEGSTPVGRLLAFDAAGKVVESLADGVRRLHVASVMASGEFIILYEHDRQFVIALVNAKTLRKQREQAFAIPALK